MLVLPLHSRCCDRRLGRARDLCGQIIHQLDQVSLPAGSDLSKNAAGGKIGRQRRRTECAESDDGGMRERDTKRERHPATDATASSADYSPEESAD